MQELTTRAIQKIFVMELQLFGINHKTTRLSDRERFIINDSNQEEFKNFIAEQFHHSIESFFALSTCNRTEIYLYGDRAVAFDVLKRTAKFLGFGSSIEDSCYHFSDFSAMRHMCAVASGLDSQVLGEQEIFGQFKKSVQSFESLGVLHTNLKNITDIVTTISKAARTETNIGRNPLSVSGLSLKIVREIFEIPQDQQITIVGAGQMGLSVIEHFYDNGLKEVCAINRTRKNLRVRGLSLNTEPLTQLSALIEHTDILISSINTTLPIIGKGMIENALKLRKNKPMLLIDLGVPRNVENQVRELDNAYLFTIEDMELVTQDNLNERAVEAEKAKTLIDEMLFDSLGAEKSKINRSEAFAFLESCLTDLSEDSVQQIIKSADPYQELKLILGLTKVELQCLEYLSHHAISSIIKEIKSA